MLARALLCWLCMKKTLASALSVLAFACGGGASDVVEPVVDPNGAPVTMPGAPTAPVADPSSPPPGTPPPSAPSSAGAFAGAPAYVATLGPSTIDLSGKGNGHLSFNAGGNPAGRPCLDCHDGSTKGGAPAFLFAGTVYENAQGKAAARIEVRMVGADGKALSTHTDDNGNFFFRASAGTVAIPAIAGVRNATTAHSMSNKINDANCNQCHGTTARLVM